MLQLTPRLAYARRPDPRLIGLYNQLLREATVVGSSALPVSNIRTGSRLSTTSQGVLVPEDTPDLTIHNSLHVLSSMAGATNLVDTDLTAAGWSKNNVTVDSNVITDDSTNAQHRALYIVPSISDSTDIAYCLDIKAGTLNTADVQIRTRANAFPTASIDLADGSSTNSGFDSLSSELLPDGWVRVCVLQDSGAGATDPAFYIFPKTSTPYIGGGGTIQVRNVRVANLSAPAAAFPDGSAAGATYGADLLSCAPSWGSQGTIMTYATAYDWSISPSDFARVFEVNSGGLRIEQFQDTSSWFPFDPGGVSFPVVINPYVGNAAAVWSIDWDGVTSGSRINTETRNTQAQTSTPSGTLYVGNNSFGTSPFHGPFVTLLWPYVLNQIQYLAMYNGLISRLSTLGSY